MGGSKADFNPPVVSHGKQKNKIYFWNPENREIQNSLENDHKHKISEDNSIPTK